MRPIHWIPGAALAAGLAYAALVEPRWLQVRRTHVHVRRLPAALEGVTIGLLTDLHAGRFTPRSVIRRAVRALMAARPALIAITGDIADSHAHGFDEVLAALAPLRAPLGVYAVPGNHDHQVGIAAWRRGIEASPAIVDLTNRAIIIPVRGARLCVAGVDDYFLGRPQLQVPPPAARDFTLLLAHAPDQAERSRRHDDAVDLIVGGHTHGGQIRLPFIGAPLQASTRPDLYDAGLRRRPWTQVYTSRGVGTVHLPLRFLARPEVAVLTLTAAPRAPRAGLAFAPFRRQD